MPMPHWGPDPLQVGVHEAASFGGKTNFVWLLFGRVGYKLVTEDLAGACVVWLVDAVGFTYTGWLTCTVVLATFFGY